MYNAGGATVASPGASVAVPLPLNTTDVLSNMSATANTLITGESGIYEISYHVAGAFSAQTLLTTAVFAGGTELSASHLTESHSPPGGNISWDKTFIAVLAAGAQLQIRLWSTAAGNLSATDRGILLQAKRIA
ncbi:MAG: hypothetical protein LBQ33_05690 [Oscillospiraceae bacterium]|jgi:hypothetical protein|nr:hypothetical protein [Oscillospiraceae bacterium]